MYRCKIITPIDLTGGFYRQSTNVSIVKTVKRQISTGHGVPSPVIRSLKWVWAKWQNSVFKIGNTVKFICLNSPINR